MLRTNIDLLTFIKSQSANGQNGIFLKNFNQGDILLSQGDDLINTYIISDGISKCFITEENGKSYLFEFLGKGEIIGEIEALKHINCLCSIEALTPLSAFVIPKANFLELLKQKPDFAFQLLQTLSSRLIQTSSRSSYQQLYSLDYAISKLLQLQKESNLQLSKEDMAAYLGISVRSYNRVLKQIRDF